MSEQSKDGWQDIASAPKDGTWILGYEPRRHVEDTIRVWQWVGHAGEYGTGLWIDAADSCDADEQPTHFMPLPTPPAKGD